MDGKGTVVVAASQELDLPVFKIDACAGIATDAQHLYLMERDSVKRLRILVNWKPQEHQHFPSATRDAIRLAMMERRRGKDSLSPLNFVPKEIVLLIFSFLQVEFVPGVYGEVR
jgi:hypothetical protein